MKKALRGVLLFFVAFLLTSTAFAEAVMTFGSEGTTISIVNAFNKAVAANGGSIDKNAQTEYSATGDFDKVKAKLFVEKDGAVGKLKVRINVRRKEVDVVKFLVFGNDLETETVKAIVKHMADN
jgi:hypothetical protein